MEFTLDNSHCWLNESSPRLIVFQTLLGILWIYIIFFDVYFSCCVSLTNLRAGRMGIHVSSGVLAASSKTILALFDVNSSRWGLRFDKLNLRYDDIQILSIAFTLIFVAFFDIDSVSPCCSSSHYENKGYATKND
jgi:hypothetical protein